MKNKILIIIESPQKKELFVNILPSLGVLYIASYPDARGVSVDIKDCYVDKERIIDYSEYDYIGFSVNIANAESTVNTINDIKRSFPEVKIVIGGPMCGCTPEAFFSIQVEAIFVGESEISVYEYITREDKTSVKGIYVQSGTQWVFTGTRPFIEDLDKLSFPAFDKIPIRKYYSPIKKKHPMSIIVTSRGCPYKCIFCYHSMGYKLRYRSAKNVVDEIEWQVKKYKIKEIGIFDDNFTMNYERASEICDRIISRNIKVRVQLSNGVRADKIDEQLLVKLKRAGVWLIGIAPEVGNKYSLRRIRKQFSLVPRQFDFYRRSRWKSNCTGTCAEPNGLKLDCRSTRTG